METSGKYSLPEWIGHKSQNCVYTAKIVLPKAIQSSPGTQEVRITSDVLSCQQYCKTVLPEHQKGSSTSGKGSPLHGCIIIHQPIKLVLTQDIVDPQQVGTIV